ncbi:hypothetical protein JCM19235_1882 [Vibrio maritimus]|uniref:Inactive transglutaminase fused to 7 transmembrane helices domain-containing protein n=1 Tax=Vibrio maritimus TaxID=990268 RepID=A0A090RW67_9VIBR|nr:hypothetical protein JCM19235_1882 [Vibrio maritimus]
MTSRIPFFLSVGLLIAAGIALSVIRHDTYGVPWTPGETRQVWDIEARVEFNAIGKPAKVSLAAPYTQEGFTLIGESAHHLATVSLMSILTQVAALNGLSAKRKVHRPSTTKLNFLWMTKLSPIQHLLQKMSLSQPLMVLKKLPRLHLWNVQSLALLTT